MDEERDGAEVVFVSYSREDAEWRRRFVDMLKPVVREQRLDVWSDDRLLVGAGWRPQIEDAIGRSRAALVLVSPSLLASDFVMREELPALVARGVSLVCVLVRPCLWEEVALLRDVQWAHDPGRDGPLDTSSDPEGQIVRVCKRLLGLVPARAAGSPEPSSDVARPAVRRRAAAIEAAAQPGALHEVPPLPAGFVAREELDGLRSAVLHADDGAVGITGKALGLHGQGGIGKTVLAAALARDDGLRLHFPDGIHWVTLGERPDLVAAQIALLARLGAPHDELRSTAKGVALLRSALAERRCLLVVDDVWSVAAAQSFAAAGARGRVLYTTRDAGVLRAVGAEVRRVDVLPESAARELLAGLAGVAVEELPREAASVLDATGRVALALALVGAAVGRGGRGWRDVADALGRGGETFLDHPYANTFKAMQVAVGALDAELAEAYATLAVYPEDTRIPVAAVARYWSWLHDVDLAETRARIAALAGRRLLSLDDDAIAFHDLQRDFLLLHVHDLALRHEDLLRAYRELLPSRDAAWRGLARDEPYIWEHLLYHLKGAGDAPAILATTGDLAYVALRAFRSGPHAAESDLRMAADVVADDPTIGWLRRVLAQSAHLLGGQRTVGDLAATLATRVRDAPAGVDAEALTELLPDRCLVARWGLPGAAPALARVLEGHTDGVRAVAFSPDGRRLASAADDATVRLWDTATGTPAQTLEGHAGGVYAVAFSPDGRRLASAGDDGTVRLWDTATGTPAQTLEGHAGGVHAVAFSPDGRRLASAGGDGTVRLWDTATGTPAQTLEGHTDWVHTVAFSPDGRQLASAGNDGTVRLWDTATGTTAQTLEGHTDWVHTVAFSPDGRQLASAGNDRTVRLWDTATGTTAQTLEGHTDWVRAVAFSPDGRQLASAGDDRTVRLWDTATGTTAQTLEGHTDWVRAVAFSPDGRQLASAGDDGTVRLWDTATGTTAQTLEGHTDWVRAVAFSPDGRRLASAGDDGTVRLWDTATGTPAQTLEGHTDWVHTVAFSPDGRQLASAGNDRTVRLWDTATGTTAQTLEGHTDWVHTVAFSPDGRQLASAGNDGTVRLWDTATGTTAQTLEGHTDWVHTVAFSPDGRQLASAGNDRTVRLWDTATGTTAQTLEGHTDWVHTVAFSPDGRQLASAGDDGTVRLWDTATGTTAQTLEGHTDWVRAVAFSPDGRQLASAGDDQTVRLWDAATGSEISALRLDGAVTALAWGSCGIAVASSTSVIVLDVVCGGAPPESAGKPRDD